MKCEPSGERCYFIDYYNNWPNIYEYSVASGNRRVVLPNAFTVINIYGYKAQSDELYIKNHFNLNLYNFTDLNILQILSCYNIDWSSATACL